LESVKKGIKKGLSKTKEELIEVNLKALQRGFNFK